MLRARSLHIIVSSCAYTLLHSLAAAQPSFQGLGTLPGTTYSDAADVASGPLVVVGLSSEFPSQGYRWTPRAGMVGLGDLPGGTFYSAALGVSADGSVVVGQSSGFGGLHATRWTLEQGFVDLGTIGGASGQSIAHDVSADGTIIAGSSDIAGVPDQAFRWTARTGMVGLGFLPGTVGSFALGISDDGSTIVGESYGPGFFDKRPFRWTEATGMVELGLLPGFTSGTATAASGDGQVVIGSLFATNPQVFRWSIAEGLTVIGPGTPSGVSGDGALIVGRSLGDAFIWDKVNGVRNLQAVLADDFGLDLGDWWLEHAAAISADGTRIVGVGRNPDGQIEAWLAIIPEPGSLALLLAGGAFLLYRRRLVERRTTRPTGAKQANDDSAVT